MKWNEKTGIGDTGADMTKSGGTKLRALPEQSSEELSELKQKIRIHRMKILILILVGISIVIGLCFAAFIYFVKS